jgi:hypothetical protein
MSKRVSDIPPERRRQFDLLEVARTRVIEWSRAEEIPMEHVEFIVPFVTTDFSVRTVFFYRTRGQVNAREGDGSSGRLCERFKDALREAGYPEEWMGLVRCSFASKQEVDEYYEGSYFYFLR